MGTSADQEHYGARLRTVIPRNLEVVGGCLSKTIRFENAAGILEDTEDYEKAEEKFREAAAGYTGAFGQDHPYSLACMDRLASMYRNMNRLEDAKALFKKVVRVRNQVEHADPDTVNRTSNLASICKDQQQRDEEERWETMVGIFRGDKTLITEDGMAHIVLLF